MQTVLSRYHDATLLGVACVSAKNCTAVGVSYLQSATSASSQVVVQHWNGIAWLPQAAPNPGKYNGFNAVSCSTAMACTAVGWTGDGSSSESLIERWDGKTWTAQPSVDPAGNIDASLTGVSCPTATACSAVGHANVVINYVTGEVPVLESWDGSHWQLEPAPPTSGYILDIPTGVSCASATNCTTVGWVRSATFQDSTMVDRWDGTSWSIDPAGAVPDGYYYAVSCPTPLNCMSVGSTSPPDRGLSAEWNG